ncbi:MAG: hypothetical protein KDM91_05600 [Verrucomicrobiae bacterium]|nr:hypothetical protein [Verrucomicrobiae bacterium]
MKTSTFAIVAAALGLLLTAVGGGNLRGRDDDSVRFHRNPFAIQRSAYGRLLARLSQDTINQVWHIGVEQVNPVGHVHGPECADGHCEADHDHDHEAEAHADHDHDHAEAGEGLAESGEKHFPGCEKFHDHGESGGEHDHDHDHDGHEHGHGFDVADWIGEMKDGIVEMSHARYERTNPRGISELHRKAIAGDIERKFLNAYRMDPTDYGVYNGYFLFLTIHELRATPLARDHARLVSRHTIGEARREDTDPSAWLTATMAAMNLFFLDQEDWKTAGEEPSAAKIREHQALMRHCMRQYQVLKLKSMVEGRWETISGDRREDMRQREYFAGKAFEQFDAMLARIEGKAGEGATSAVAGAPAEGTEPVAENGGEKE